MKATLLCLASLVVASFSTEHPGCGADTPSVTPSPTSTTATPKPTTVTPEPTTVTPEPTVDCPFTDGSSVSLTSDSVNYIGSEYFWDPTLITADLNPYQARWYVHKVGPKMALGYAADFLGQCSGATCPAGHTDAITQRATITSDAAVLWSCIKASNDRWVLQGNDGRVMTACTTCTSSTGAIAAGAVISAASTSAINQQWIIVAA